MLPCILEYYHLMIRETILTLVIKCITVVENPLPPPPTLDMLLSHHGCIIFGVRRFSVMH